MASETVVIIPARRGSTRYPGKPLALIRGVSGRARSLVARSIDAARAGAGNAAIWVATDDEAIAAEAIAHGANVAMTSAECRNGTERCAAALPMVGLAENIVNVQGDALLTPPHYIRRLIDRMHTSDAAVATVAVRASTTTLQHLFDDAAQGRVGGTTVVVDRQSNALYFSKHILPFGATASGPEPVLMHLGLYAYRPVALAAYSAAEESVAERSEGLEQLRFLDMGTRIGVEVVGPVGWDPIELNNPSDIPAIEAALALRGIE